MPSIRLELCCRINMSAVTVFTVFVMAVLLGSSLVMTFVLNTSERETATSTVPQVARNNRCQEQLQSIKKDLLDALNLQTEPRLPAGWLDSVRDQWKSTFNAMTPQTQNGTGFDLSVTPGNGHSPGIKCCQMSSQISLKDLGWNNWVIFPESFTLVQCGSCNPLLEPNNLRCPSHTPPITKDNSSQAQLPGCQSISQVMMPVLYMEAGGTVVISSVQLTRTCGCVADTTQLPTED